MRPSRTVPDDDYPFPIDDLLPVDASDEVVAKYEETVVRLLNDWIDKQGGSVHGQSGVLLSVDISGGGPTSRLRLGYRSHAGGEYHAFCPLWDDQGVSAPRMAAGRPSLESPNGLGAIVASDWADGSVHADDDPYWAAVERQRHAIRGWRAAFPEAAAALPVHEPSATVEERRAAWVSWAERFPDAVARHAEVWRPVEDFLE
jgi:hypothetical protein